MVEYTRGDIVKYGTNRNWFVNAVSYNDGVQYVTLHGLLLDSEERIAKYGGLVPASDCLLVKKKKEIKLPKMSKPAITAGIILAFIAFVGMWFAGNYNSLVTARNQVDNSWASVETEYQRRLDLINNLVESVKGQQTQEKEVFIAIANARQRVIDATDQESKVKATNDLETNIALLPRLQEAYPELKTNELMNSLMKELVGTENGITDKRDNYNKVATNYNTNIERFPKNMFANTFGFKKYTLFKAEQGAEKGAKVEF